MHTEKLHLYVTIRDTNFMLQANGIGVGSSHRFDICGTIERVSEQEREMKGVFFFPFSIGWIFSKVLA